MNKVFTVELCQEDAQRIINGLNDYKDKVNVMIDECEDELCKDAAWLEWSYVSELLYNLEYVFDVNNW